MLLFSLIFACIYLYAGIKSADTIYLLCIIMGFANGYWAMFVTIGAEQFGTNLRATAATTIPNMVRGTVVATTALFGFLKPNWGVTNAAAGVGFICFALAFIAIATIEESHGKDLDYLEE